MRPRQLRRHYIREWRKYRGYSLRRLADMMEIEPGIPLMSHANLGRVENRQQPYNQDLLEALALALQCEVSDLLTVNPLKDGDVVDMMSELRRKDPATVRAFLSALPDKTGSD